MSLVAGPFDPVETLSAKTGSLRAGPGMGLIRSPICRRQFGPSTVGSYGGGCAVGGLSPEQRRVRGYFPYDGQVHVAKCMQDAGPFPDSSRTVPPFRAPLQVSGQ